MKEFCIGLALLMLIGSLTKNGIKARGILGVALLGCGAWGLGAVVVLLLGSAGACP